MTEQYIYFLKDELLLQLLVIYFFSLQKLEELLEALYDSELHYDKTNECPFVSDTTLGALRMTIISTIELTHHLLFDMDYEFVLTGKFNQDCVEVSIIFIEL